MDAPCTCPDPALCARLGRHILGRLWDIWQGTADGLTQTQCEAYRQHWTRQAAPPARETAAQRAARTGKVLANKGKPDD